MKLGFLVQGRARSPDADLAFLFCCEGSTPDPVAVKREAIHRALQEGVAIRSVESVQQSTAVIDKNGVQHFCFVTSGIPKTYCPGTFLINQLNKE